MDDNGSADVSFFLRMNNKHLLDDFRADLWVKEHQRFPQKTMIRKTLLSPPLLRGWQRLGSLFAWSQTDFRLEMEQHLHLHLIISFLKCVAFTRCGVEKTQQAAWGALWNNSYWVNAWIHFQAGRVKKLWAEGGGGGADRLQGLPLTTRAVSNPAVQSLDCKVLSWQASDSNLNLYRSDNHFLIGCSCGAPIRMQWFQVCYHSDYRSLWHYCRL